jgi:hypothetical protein
MKRKGPLLASILQSHRIRVFTFKSVLEFWGEIQAEIKAIFVLRRSL